MNKILYMQIFRHCMCVSLVSQPFLCLEKKTKTAAQLKAQTLSNAKYDYFCPHMVVHIFPLNFTFPVIIYKTLVLPLLYLCSV